MKRFFNLLKRTPTLAVFLFILLFYMPLAISYPSETERNSIVSAVGIDKEEEILTLSLLCFVPQANMSYQEKLEVITCDGKSISENLEKAGRILGRDVNLNHVESIILSQNLFEEDISKVLDYFSRSPVVLTGCLVAGTNGKAQDVIKTIKEINTQSGLKFEEILRYSESNYYNKETTIDSFYDGYYSPTSTSLLSYIELTNSGKNGIAPSSSQNDSPSQEQGKEESGSSNSGEQKKGISNLGNMIALKNGKIQTLLTSENLRVCNYFRTNNGKGLITLKDAVLNDDRKAEVVYEIVDNKVLKRVDFHNGMPLVRVKIRLNLDLYEIVDKRGNQQDNIAQYKITPSISEQIEKKVKDEISDTLSIFRQNKIDPLGIYELMMKSDRKKAQAFLDMLDDKEDFLNYIVFAISVESEAI